MIFAAVICDVDDFCSVNTAFLAQEAILAQVCLLLLSLLAARFISSIFQLVSAVLMVRKGFRLHEGLAREILEALFSSPRKAPQQQGRRHSVPGEWRKVQRKGKESKTGKKPKPSRRQSTDVPEQRAPRPPPARVPVSPDQLSSAAQEKVRCLEAAIAALGPNPAATVLKTLQDALQAAR